MTMEGIDLIRLESNLHKYDPVITSQIINLIETDNFGTARRLSQS